MVTIHGLTWDDDRLLELVMMLDSADRGRILRGASVAACYARSKRAAATAGRALDESAETVTRMFLRRCAPRLPCGWVSDTGFQFEVENAVWGQLKGRELDMVLTSADHDEHNAAILADWADEHAQRVRTDFCAPEFEDGYVSVQAMRAFIEGWRDSFMSNLRRLGVPGAGEGAANGA